MKMKTILVAFLIILAIYLLIQGVRCCNLPQKSDSSKLDKMFLLCKTNCIMKKKAHSESQMVSAVKELEGGLPADLVARNYGISKATLYNWKSKYSGMDVRQVKRLKELEEENRKLKQMYADLALDNRILKEVIEKKFRARD